MTASALGRGGAPWCGAPGRTPSPRAARSQEEASRRTRPPNPSYSLLGFRVHPPRPLKGELFLNANASVGAFVDTVGYAQSEDALASGNQRDRNTFGYAYSEDALASGNPRNRNAFGYAYSEDALASVQNASVASILSKKCVTVVIFRTWKLQNARMASILSKKCVTVVVFKPSKRQNILRVRGLPGVENSENTLFLAKRFLKTAPRSHSGLVTWPECERGVDFKLKVCNCRRFQAFQAPQCERGVDFRKENSATLAFWLGHVSRMRAWPRF